MQAAKFKKQHAGVSKRFSKIVSKPLVYTFLKYHKTEILFVQ